MADVAQLNRRVGREISIKLEDIFSLLALTYIQLSEISLSGLVLLRKNVDAHVKPDLQLCPYSTDENQIPLLFSPQITRGQNLHRKGSLGRAETAGFKVVWHPEAATSWSSSQQMNY